MKVMQIFNVNAIMDICRENDLFTLGTAAEFEELYNWYNKFYSDESLFELANYIDKYSNNILAIHDIAGIILREGVTRYIDDEN